MRKFKTLFLDIGGVLLTNGWDREARKKSATRFALDPQELDDRHRLIFNTYERGKLTMEDYLDHVIFFKDRNFTRDEFKNFMFEQSQPLGDAIGFFKQIKEQLGCTVVAVSNEIKELNEHRIEKYKLTELFDFFYFLLLCAIAKAGPRHVYAGMHDDTDTSRRCIFY